MSAINTYVSDAYSHMYPGSLLSEQDNLLNRPFKQCVHFTLFAGSLHSSSQPRIMLQASLVLRHVFLVSLAKGVRDGYEPTLAQQSTHNVQIYILQLLVVCIPLRALSQRVVA